MTKEKHGQSRRFAANQMRFSQRQVKPLGNPAHGLGWAGHMDHQQQGTGSGSLQLVGSWGPAGSS